METTPLITFAYQAQTADEQPLAGTIDARDVESAMQRLLSLGLRVLELHPSERPARPRPLRGEDFIAFNRQLAQLTAAGLPVEYGLRLIARDMRSGRLAATLQLVAGDLEKGLSLPEAFQKHQAQFPPLYSRLVQAGISANNLPGMLLNLGRHLELVQRLRALLWRASSYPLMVLVGLILIVLFLGIAVLPPFGTLFAQMKIQLPLVTLVLLAFARAAPWIAIGLLALIVLIALAWNLLRLSGADRRFVDLFVLPLPLVGPVLRWNLVARWCDALRLAVEAGLDLPAGIELASESVASPALSRDAAEVRSLIEAGQAARSAANLRLRVLPATVPAAIGLASERNDLAATLGNLSATYQQQAELRMGSIPTVLAPVLLVVIALLITLVVLGLFGPLISLIQSFTVGFHK